MDLSLLGGSGGMGLLWLAPGNIIGPRSSGGGIFENAVTVSGLDISGAVMTEAFSADVDDGEILAIRSLSVGSMPTAAATFDYELEIDGEVVASKSIASLTNSSVYILGTAVSESSFTANVAFNVGVKSNVKLRVKRPAGIAVTVSMLFAKLKRG
ncbi:MAG: hypothetical protein U5L02_11250 [Rheinheimera sp.]|nr:hypothetical protein [Rheinheimera sp.]